MSPANAVREAFDSATPDMGDRETRHAFWESLGGTRGGTRAMLAALGRANTASNRRQVERWVTLSGQRREPRGAARESLNRLAAQSVVRRLRQRGAQAVFSGSVRVSNDARHRERVVDIDPDNRYLDETAAALALGDDVAAGEALQRAFFEAWGPGLEAAAWDDVESLEIVI